MVFEKKSRQILSCFLAVSFGYLLLNDKQREQKISKDHGNFGLVIMSVILITFSLDSCIDIAKREFDAGHS